ncbi:HU family DNA-binding protein [Fusobacterium varium]
MYGNPRTKERIVIPAKKVLKFTVGKKFAERVKNS